MCKHIAVNQNSNFLSVSIDGQYLQQLNDQTMLEAGAEISQISINAQTIIILKNMTSPSRTRYIVQSLLGNAVLYANTSAVILENVNDNTIETCLFFVNSLKSTAYRPDVSLIIRGKQTPLASAEIITEALIKNNHITSLSLMYMNHEPAISIINSLPISQLRVLNLIGLDIETNAAITNRLQGLLSSYLNQLTVTLNNVKLNIKSIFQSQHQSSASAPAVNSSYLTMRSPLMMPLQRSNLAPRHNSFDAGAANSSSAGLFSQFSTPAAASSSSINTEQQKQILAAQIQALEAQALAELTRQASLKARKTVELPKLDISNIDSSENFLPNLPSTFTFFDRQPTSSAKFIPLWEAEATHTPLPFSGLEATTQVYPSWNSPKPTNAEEKTERTHNPTSP
ncbi:MAG: hypothetical protein P4M12_03205 [Gammaproteobacteria bacterium]|nr:hypothetical protein [Gammaproteobacteria bacterium]